MPLLITGVVSLLLEAVLVIDDFDEDEVVVDLGGESRLLLLPLLLLPPGLRLTTLEGVLLAFLRWWSVS